MCWPQGQVSQHSSRLHSHILFISQNREAWTLVPTGSHRWPLLSPAYSPGGQSLALATSGLGGMAATGVPRATTCQGWGPRTRHGHQVMSAHRAMHGSAQTSWTKAAPNVLHSTSPQSLKLGTASSMSKKLAEVKVVFTLILALNNIMPVFSLLHPAYYTGRESLNHFSVFMNSQCALTFSAINWKMPSTILKLLFPETQGSYLVLFLAGTTVTKRIMKTTG